MEEQKLDAHRDWVRDVAWAPSVGLQRSIIASCSQVSHQIHTTTTTSSTVKKVGFFYSATYSGNAATSRAVQS